MTAAMLAAYPERFAGGAIVAGVPYGCADTVAKALECMKPGIDQTPAEWRRLMRNSAGGDGRAPPVSIWHGDADERVVPRQPAGAGRAMDCRPRDRWQALAPWPQSAANARGLHGRRRRRASRERVGQWPRARLSHSHRKHLILRRTWRIRSLD